jgi:hypothetical protein
MKQPCNAHAYEQEAKERAQILMRLKAGYKPIHNGNYATLCNKCNAIITTGLQDEIMCESCIKEIEVKLIDEDKE